jgi:DNA-directed RNA polymerase subunit RPC12/RpoP
LTRKTDASVAKQAACFNCKLVTNKYVGDIPFVISESENAVPQRVICSGCSHILYEGPDLKPPDEVLQQYDGKCPRCGKKLSLLPIDVEVKPIK